MYEIVVFLIPFCLTLRYIQLLAFTHSTHSIIYTVHNTMSDQMPDIISASVCVQKHQNHTSDKHCHGAPRYEKTDNSFNNTDVKIEEGCSCFVGLPITYVYF